MRRFHRTDWRIFRFCLVLYTFVILVFFFIFVMISVCVFFGICGATVFYYDNKSSALFYFHVWHHHDRNFIFIFLLKRCFRPDFWDQYIGLILDSAAPCGQTNFHFWNQPSPTFLNWLIGPWNLNLFLVLYLFFLIFILFCNLSSAL